MLCVVNKKKKSKPKNLKHTFTNENHAMVEKCDEKELNKINLSRKKNRNIKYSRRAKKGK